MGLRRGFKTEADWYAADVRRSLGLEAGDPLCPWSLADHLDHIVVPLGEYAAAHPREVALLRGQTGPKGFSAVTLCVGGDRLVIYNDRHAPTRQAADIAHELAHGLLMHQPMPLTSGTGARHYDRASEDEAHWLGPALLVSREAALMIARGGEAPATAAARYKVSLQLMQMRLRMTGALRRARAST